MHRRRPLATVGLLVVALLLQGMPMPTVLPYATAASEPGIISTGKQLPTVAERLGGGEEPTAVSPEPSPKDREAGPLRADGSFTLPPDYVSNPDAATIEATPGNYGETKRSAGKPGSDMETMRLDVSGNITANTTWTLANSPYVVTGSIMVTSPAVLTIEPGVVVKFNPGAALIASTGATLTANGTVAAPIIFTSIKDDSAAGDTNGDGGATSPAPGDWYRLAIEGQTGPSGAQAAFGSLTNVIARYGQSTEIRFSKPTVSDSTFTKMSSWALQLDTAPATTWTLDRLTLSDSNYGLYLYNMPSTATVQNSYIRGNTGYGVTCGGTKASKLTSNSIDYNLTWGVSGCAGTILRYNSIAHNKPLTGGNAGKSLGVLSSTGTTDAQYNWWGSTSGPAVNGVADTGGGSEVSASFVTYTNWLGKAYEEEHKKGNFPWAKKAGVGADVATGNLVISHSDFSIPTIGFPLEVVRTYNSKTAATHTSELGAGWQWTYGTNLNVSADTYGGVVWEQADGARNYFKKTNSTFTPEEGIYSTLSYDAVTTKYTLTHKDQTKFVFDSAGKLLQQVDQDGNTTVIARAADGKIQTITEPTGRQLTVTYNAGGQISQIVDPLGRKYIYAFGLTPSTTISVTKKTSADVTFASCTYGFTTYVYQLTTVNDCDGNKVVMTYDASKRVSTQQWNGNNQIRFTYGPATDTPTGLVLPTGSTGVWDERAKANIFYYTKANKVFERDLEQSIDSTGQYFWYVMDEWGFNGYKAATHTVFDRGTTASLYDMYSGNLMEVTAPGSRKTTYTYDAWNNRTSEKDNLNRTTTFTYDAEHHPTSITDPLNNVTATTYTAAGLPATVTDARNKVTTFTYDAYGYPATATNAANETLTFSYDAGGRKLWEETPTGKRTSYTYDDRDQVKTVTDPLLNVTTTTYDTKGRKSTVQDAEGRTTTYTYNDTRNLLWKTADAKGGVVEFTYDNYGENLASVKDAAGHTTTFQYNAYKQRTSETDANGKVTRSNYGVTGELKTTTDALNNVTTYTHNTANDLTTIAYQDAKTVTQTFDGVGNRLTMVDWLGTSTWTYDALNRVSTHTDASGNVIGYSYDSGGNVATMTYPGSKVVTYTYDNANRIATVTDWDNRVTSYSYDTSGRMGSFTLPNGVVTTYGYDNANRVTDIDHVKAPTTIAALDYTFDKVGNRLTRTNSGGVESYAYDELYRITNVTYPGNQLETYTYDATGNRTAKTAFSKTTDYTYDNADQLLNAGDGVRTYDNTGQLTKVGSHLGYTWDARQQLTQISDAPANTAPTANVGANFSAFVDRLIFLDGRLSSDPEGEQLTYAWTESPSNPATGILRGTASAQPGFTTSTAGTYVFSLIVTDGRASSPSASVTVTVQTGAPTNQTLSSIAAATASGYLVTAATTAPTFSSDMQTGTFSTTVYNGVAQFVLPSQPRDTVLSTASLDLMGKSNVSNGVGDAWSVQLLPTSLDANWTTRPSNTIAAATEDTTLSPVLSGTGQVVLNSLDSWTFGTSDLAALQNRLNGSGKLSIRTKGNQATAGSRVNWYGGNATTSTNRPKVSLTFVPAPQYDHAPVAQAGRDQNVAANAQVTLNGSGSYDYEGAVTYAWTTAASNPAAVTLSDATVVNPTFTPTTLGQYRFSLVVTDNASAVSVADELIVNVVKELAPATTTFVYNGDGDRVKQTKGGVDTTYVVHSVPKNEQVLMETTGTTTTYHVYGQDLLYSIDASGPHYLHKDSLGSTVAVTDSTGAVEQTYDYDIFGAIRSAGSASGNRYTFTGQENDASELVYLRARYYDPATGRFIARDAFPVDAKDTQTVHRYVYVKNNPTNYVDPSGEVFETLYDGAMVVIDIIEYAAYASVPGAPMKEVRENLIADGISAVVPFVPAGTSRAVRGGAKAINASKNVVNRTPSKYFKAFRYVKNGVRTNGKKGGDLRYYKWDPSHGGEIEVYDARGNHLGVQDGNGKWIKRARSDRNIYDELR